MSARILVVDDEPNLLRLISYSLEMEGYKIETARSGQEAFEKIQGELPDLVILDVMLPDMSGLQVCRSLRGHRSTEDLPIIMLSARAQVPDKINGLQAGADEYVTKPVDSDEMVARVQALLKRTRRLREARPAKRGKVVGFIGAKGGVGTSTVALNVALALSQGQRPVIAVEIRSYFGTFSLQLACAPTHTLDQLIQLDHNQINQGELSACLVSFLPNLKVLFGPQSVDGYREIPYEYAEAIILRLADMADYVIMDLPCHPNETTQAGLRCCDFVTLVVDPDPTCVTTGKVTLEMLQRWGISGERVGAVIVNRSAVRVQMLLSESLPAIHRELGCGILGVIPPARELCVEAQKAGLPLMSYQPNNIVAITLSELADRLTSEQVVPLELF